MKVTQQQIDDAKADIESIERDIENSATKPPEHVFESRTRAIYNYLNLLSLSRGEGELLEFMAETE